MKKTIGLALLPLALYAGACQAEENLQPQIKEGKTVIKAFAKELLTALQEGLKKDGPASAITVCKDIAPSIADKHGKKTGWTVKRTSLKIRNPDNAPDAWELAVLKEFEARKAAGEDPKEIAKAVVVEEGGQKYFRMMKAIPTMKLCVQCHGEAVKQSVEAALDKDYPKDQARGFKEGDIRGAFSLKKPL
jgi:hypothetical protein